MVVNQKKLRNRIFKISFSVVISALAIVLGLSVRSNAKADTFTRINTPFSSYYLSLNDENLFNVPYSVANGNEYFRTGSSSYWLEWANNGNSAGLWQYRDFVLMESSNTIIMYVPFECMTYNNEYILPNRIYVDFSAFIDSSRLVTTRISNFLIDMFYYDNSIANFSSSYYMRYNLFQYLKFFD